MTEQFCKHMQVVLLQPVETQKTALFSLYVLHFVFSPVATLGNALAIRARWKASSLTVDNICIRPRLHSGEIPSE